MTDKPNLAALKAELQKLYNDFQADLPNGNSPQEIQALRQQAAHATASMLTLSLYRRSLEEYIKKREAEIILANPDVATPRELNLKALVNQELAAEKSYHSQLDTMIEIARTRCMLVMSMLKSLGQEVS